MSNQLNAKMIYDLSLQQIAAESFLDFAQTSNFSGSNLANALRLGSNNYSIPENIADPTQAVLPGKTRMTNQQLTDFNANYVMLPTKRTPQAAFPAR